MKRTPVPKQKKLGSKDKEKKSFYREDQTKQALEMTSEEDIFFSEDFKGHPITNPDLHLH